nr:unnamed protein product [Spirometra erinaceieuropaei]
MGSFLCVTECAFVQKSCTTAEAYDCRKSVWPDGKQNQPLEFKEDVAAAELSSSRLLALRNFMFLKYTVVNLLLVK